MPEARVDPLSGLRILVATDRDGRPGARAAASAPEELDQSDPFAEGNEHLTPPEVWADRPDGDDADSPGWRVRVVPNKFPALDQTFAAPVPADELGMTRGMPDLLVAGPAAGVHEVMINSPRPVRSLAELGHDELVRVVRGWAARLEAHAEDAAYVHVCVNERREAGATLAHSHSQIFALGFVPAAVARERERMRAYHEHTQGRILLEDLLIEETRKQERLVAIDEHAVLIAPFASASPYRLMIVPRRPTHDFAAGPEAAVGMLRSALLALRRVLEPRASFAPPLNLWLRSGPADWPGYCWRIELAPRLGQPAGFELGTGSGICSLAPERAARELSEALA